MAAAFRDWKGPKKQPRPGGSRPWHQHVASSHSRRIERHRWLW